MFHTVHVHISYGPYDRLRYQDARPKYLECSERVKTKVMTLCKHFPNLYMQSVTCMVGVFGSLHEVPLSIENYICREWLVIGADYCKVECGQ